MTTLKSWPESSRRFGDVILIGNGSVACGGDAGSTVATAPTTTTKAALVGGLAWSRVPHDEAAFGGSSTQVMLSLAVGGPGLVAVGAEASGDDGHAAVWVSPPPG